MCVCGAAERVPERIADRPKDCTMSGGGTFAETSPLPLTSVEEMLPFHEELPSWYC